MSGYCTRARGSTCNQLLRRIRARTSPKADSTGLARFTTIYPGWYSGRITHVHFRVHLGNSLEATSQLAFPQDITRTVYASSLYAARGQNTSVTGFGADNVFSDCEQYQLCTMTRNAPATTTRR
jgi:protocatechuate 3,4-dioxygenase beta subunit